MNINCGMLPKCRQQTRYQVSVKFHSQLQNILCTSILQPRYLDLFKVASPTGHTVKANNNPFQHHIQSSVQNCMSFNAITRLTREQY